MVAQNATEGVLPGLDRGEPSIKFNWLVIKLVSCKAYIVSYQIAFYNIGSRFFFTSQTFSVNWLILSFLSSCDIRLNQPLYFRGH